MRRLILSILTAALVVSHPLSALAQSETAPASPDTSPSTTSADASPRLPVSSSGIGVRVFFIVDANRLAASKSFKAVVGKSTVLAEGAGGDVTNIWHGLFAHVAFTHASVAGTRVFVVGTDVVSTHIPGTVSMTPIELGGGWAFQTGAVRPYVGAGLLVLKYQETWTFGSSDDDVNETFKGYTILGGVDLRVAGHIVVGVEGQYRSVPNAIGAAGVSFDFNEKNLGGVTVRLRAGVGW